MNLSDTLQVGAPESTKVAYKQNATDQNGAVDLITSPQLTQEQLIKDQQADPELTTIAQHAGSEQEVEDNPISYFKKHGVLMRKWRPPNVPSTHTWETTYQVVVP